MSVLQLQSAGHSIDGQSIVSDLDFSIEVGQVTAIIGPNGAGKSTALRLLAGLLESTSGLAVLEGTDVSTVPRRVLARQVTYVPQVTLVDVAFSVRECVAMGRYCHRGRFEGETKADQEAVDRALATTDTTSLAQRSLTELSGGELQRVILARGLATESSVLLLDEPTANLDIDHALTVLDLCRKLADEGRAIVIALHDLNSVLRIADEVYILSEGTQIAAGPPTEVLTEELLEEVFRVHAAFTAAGSEMVIHFSRTHER